MVSSTIERNSRKFQGSLLPGLVSVTDLTVLILDKEKGCRLFEGFYQKFFTAMAMLPFNKYSPFSRIP